MQIPATEQIDAFLTGQVWRLVQRYCDKRWSDLAREWTVSAAEIKCEAERRGLERFVAAKPIAEGYWLCSCEEGFEVFYFERGIRMYREVFGALPVAFDAWIANELKAMQLPRNDVRA